MKRVSGLSSRQSPKEKSPTCEMCADLEREKGETETIESAFTRTTPPETRLTSADTGSR